MIMGGVRTGAEAVVKKPVWKSFWKETCELSKEYLYNKDYKDSKWDNKTGALKATSIHRKQPAEGEKICVSYPKGEDTKGCTDLSCGFKKTIENTGYIDYTGKHLELRCQDVLYKKGCVCVPLPDIEKDPNTGNTKSSVDCLFMMDGMDEPVLADIKSVSLNNENEKTNQENRVRNIISRSETQAKDNNTDTMMLYYDNAAYYDAETVKGGLIRYARTKDGQKRNGQIKNVIIVVNDGQKPVQPINIDTIDKSTVII